MDSGSWCCYARDGCLYSHRLWQRNRSVVACRDDCERSSGSGCSQVEVQVEVASIEHLGLSGFPRNTILCPLSLGPVLGRHHRLLSDLGCLYFKLQPIAYY
eukprot:354306-Chlamydomonas_euryale.AAC.8